MTSTVQTLVDKMLDEAEAAWPGVEYSISLPTEQGLLLPVDGIELNRQVNGREGSYKSHVYRDCMVWPVELLPCLVIVGPVIGSIPEAAKADRYWGNLDTQTFSKVQPEFNSIVCAG